MRKKKSPSEDFPEGWTNQTELGKKFDFSAVTIGKILIQFGLKDPNTKQASQKALEEEYAKLTPLKDGTPHFIWNINKVNELIFKNYQKPLPPRIDYWVNNIVQQMQNNKLMSNNSIYKRIPCDIRQDVINKIEQVINSKKDKSEQ